MTTSNITTSIMDQYEPGANTKYPCYENIYSRGFTRLMMLIMALDQNPELISEIHRIIIHDPTQINTANRKKYTPLMLAGVNSKRLHSENVVKLLIKAGADIDAVNKYGNTALHLAVFNLSTNSTVNILIESGCNLNICNKYGNTPLIYGVYCFDTSEASVRMLIAFGCDLDIVNRKGNNAFQLAKECGHHKFIKILVAAGVDCNGMRHKYLSKDDIHGATDEYLEAQLFQIMRVCDMRLGLLNR